MPVGGTAAALFRICELVAVRHPTGRFLWCSGTVIYNQKRLRTNLAAECHELVRPDLVALRYLPGFIKAAGALVAWSDAVLPVVAAGEVAAWVAQERWIQRLDQRQRICPQLGPIWGPDAVIDAAL